MGRYLNRSITVLVACGPLLLAPAAQAHILLERPQAEAGSYYKAVFQVGHGCSGSPTRRIVVEVPEEVGFAKPMPKPGWTIEIDTVRLAEPYMTQDGPVTDRVTQVRWVGGTLAANHYDEFVVFSRMPGTAGPLYWKASQICEQGRLDWVEIPAGGKRPSDYKEPAPAVEVLPRGRGVPRH